MSAPASSPPVVLASASPRFRVTVDGKFFRLADARFFVKGVTYGPFAPNALGEPFASVEQTATDFRLIRELGANLVRVYHVPPTWFLELAQAHELRVLVDIPWPKHLCFLDHPALRQQAREAVRQAATACCAHPAVLGYSVVNEIPPDIVRWSGVRRMERFIEELVDEAHRADPGCLCTFGSFPPTEYLSPGNLDFITFNVYLHERKPQERYLARLQMLADAHPLLLGEFGMDSKREGTARQTDYLKTQIETAFRAGLAGTVLFSFTDDWHRGGEAITDWAFGLTTQGRQPKFSFQAVRACYATAPAFPEARGPKVSVVVASFNGARTLRICLESLDRLHYPHYEVILVDDGSTDETPEIARGFGRVRYLPIPHRGLSAARNAGIEAATGDIVAFTDSDCRADEDWLRYLVGDLLRNGFVGVGGPNFLPPEDSVVAAAVLVSPGGPAHVMLTDREAEHIPGCNMAFYKWALEEIGGFDPIFWRAGDDVDVCWRLREAGYKLGFSPAAFVWHYRRSTVLAYLRQQAGYGEAEALLARKHPDYFNSFGESVWRGRIYTSSLAGVVLRRPVIYHGIFGSGLFQRLYASQPAALLSLLNSLEFHVFVTLPLLVLSASFFPALPVALTTMTASLACCVLAAAQAHLPRSRLRWWSRPLVASLFFLQPVARGWARYRWRFQSSAQMQFGWLRLAAARRANRSEAREFLRYWSEGSVDRVALLNAIVAKLESEGWPCKWDSGWTNHDVEIHAADWSRVSLTTVAEIMDQGCLVLRCRLRTGWSLAALILFWGVLAVEAVVIGLLAHLQPWLWMIPLSLPILSGFIDLQVRTAQIALAALVDEAAVELKLKPLAARSEGPLAHAASAPDTH